MINGLNIYYTCKILKGHGLEPVSTNNKKQHLD